MRYTGTSASRAAPFCRAIQQLLMLAFVLLSGRLSLAQETAAAPVVAAPLIEAQVNSGRRVVGTVMPLRSSTIGSAADGRVIEFLVNQGDAVREGQVLSRLRTETLEIELAASRAELTLYEQQLAELENGSRREDVDEARAKMLGAQAAMQNAASKLRRLEALSASRAVSDTELGDAQERAQFARHVHEAAEALFQRVAEGPRVEQISQAEARLELQKERVRLIEDRIAKHTITAPFDGFVAAEFTEVGHWISQGDPVAQVIQLDEVEIQSPVPAEYAVQLRPGDVVRVEFPELPDELFMGQVQRIVPMADARTRTFPVYIRLQNKVRDGGPLLMAGMLARVDLPAGNRQSLLLAPKDALVLNGTQRTLFVVDLAADSHRSQASGKASGEAVGVARQVKVDLGVASGGRIEVRGDVRPGQLVVVVGNERLRDGDRVSVLRAADENAAPDRNATALQTSNQTATKGEGP